jgi:uncharacterized protein involved in exopolysaccharide biosynthesis
MWIVPSSLPRAPPQTPDAIDIGDLFNILWRRHGGYAAIVLSLGIWIVNGLKTRYSAEITLILEVANSQPVDVEAVAGARNKDTALINSEMDVLRFGGLAEKVADEHDLVADPEFNMLLRPIEPEWLARIRLTLRRKRSAGAQGRGMDK